jgi:hypothetical protein
LAIPALTAAETKIIKVGILQEQTNAGVVQYGVLMAFL